MTSKTGFPPRPVLTASERLATYVVGVDPAKGPDSAGICAVHKNPDGSLVIEDMAVYEMPRERVLFWRHYWNLIARGRRREPERLGGRKNVIFNVLTTSAPKSALDP